MKPSALLAAVERVGRGEAKAADAGAPSPPASEAVCVGTATLSPSLYAVFVNEAQQHLEILERELAAVAVSGSVQDDLVRAAHTLAGICGTVQLESMHALGHALEGALLRLRSRGARADSAELAVSFFKTKRTFSPLRIRILSASDNVLLSKDQI